MKSVSRWISLLAAVCSVAAAHGHEDRPPHNYDLQNVLWRVSFDEQTGTVFGDVTNTLKPTIDNLGKLYFDSGKLNIKSVSINGKKAAWTVTGDKLWVTLPTGIKKGQKVDARIVYDARPEAGLYIIPAKRAFPATTPVIYTQGEMVDTRYWLPTYDWPDDIATSEGYIEVPANYWAESTGHLVGVKAKGANKIYHWKIDTPMSTYLITCLAGQFERGHEQWDDIPVDFLTPPGLLKEGWAAFGGTNKMVEFYSKLTGFKYPYPKFTQTGVPDYMYGGMENTTLVINTIDTLHDENGIDDSRGLVLHELAHQWFGDTVMMPDWDNNWISEGWATFLPHFYFRMADGQATYDIMRRDTINAGAFSQKFSNRPMVCGGYEEPLDMFDGNAYSGGAARMFMLMHQVGEERFWKAVQTYLETCKHQTVSTDRFFDVMGKALGENLSTFKKQWFNTAAVPQITISESGGNLTLKQSKPYFDVNVEVGLWDGSAWTRKTIQLGDEQASLPVPSGSIAVVDPDSWLMAIYTDQRKLTGDEIVDLYRHAPTAALKARLLDEAGKLSAEQVLELARAEAHPTLLSRMLPFVKDEAFLVQMTFHANPNVRYTALQQLQRFPTSKDRIREIFNTSTALPMKEAAYRILLQMTQDEKLAEQGWQMKALDDGYRTTTIGWWAGHDKDKARQMALEVLAHSDSEPLRVTCIRLLGGLKDKPGEHVVFDALVKVAKERSFSAKSAALQSLGEYGDPAALPVVKAEVDNSLIFVRRTARAAAERLTKKG